MLTRADFAVVAAAVVAVTLAAWAVWRPGAAPEWVEIRSAGVVTRVPLARDARHAIDGRIGASVIEVAGGRARFAAAPCAARTCMAAGWLSRAGDFAACAPNGVSARIAGGSGVYDAIAH